MRNMSFILTTEQMKNRSKDVTRRLGWSFLKAGDVVMACVKCQGLGKGGKIEKIHPIRIVSVTREPLHAIWDVPIRDNKLETTREGFPLMTSWQFIDMFRKEMKCLSCDMVNRIEFEHLGGNGKGIIC